VEFPLAAFDVRISLILAANLVTFSPIGDGGTIIFIIVFMAEESISSPKAEQKTTTEGGGDPAIVQILPVRDAKLR
jgi:hypothetical protein